MIQKITSLELVGLDPQRCNFVIEYCKDWSPRRAAEASGFSPDYGYTLRDEPAIVTVITHILSKRLEASHIDAEWVLMESVDNHLIARQQGNISASNTALNLVAKNILVDSFSAEKIDVSSDREIMERLLRGRNRQQVNDVSFL